MLSVKQKIFENEIVGRPDPTKGIQSFLNPFYKQSNNNQYLPYKSIKSIITSLKWPRKFTLGPSDTLGYDRAGNLALVGLTNDGINGFVIYGTTIETRPVQNLAVLGASTMSTGTAMSAVGYNHFRDGATYFHPELGVLVFLPVGGSRVIEGDNGSGIVKEISLPGYISLFRLKNGVLDYLSGSLLKSVDSSGRPKISGESGWCAINPFNGLLYTAEIKPIGFGPLQVYKPVFEIDRYSRLTGFNLNYLGDFPLFYEEGDSVVHGIIKGAVFSQTGHLYITLEAANRKYAVVGFDMISGRKTVNIPLQLLNLEGIDFIASNNTKVLCVCVNSPDTRSYVQHIRVSGDDYHNF